jgi:hypothetical protein
MPRFNGWEGGRVRRKIGEKRGRREVKGGQL